MNLRSQKNANIREGFHLFDILLNGQSIGKANVLVSRKNESLVITEKLDGKFYGEFSDIFPFLIKKYRTESWEIHLFAVKELNRMAKIDTDVKGKLIGMLKPNNEELEARLAAFSLAYSCRTHSEQSKEYMRKFWADKSQMPISGFVPCVARFAIESRKLRSSNNF